MRTTSHTCQALLVYLPRMAHRKSAVHLLLMPIFATFSTHFAKSVKIPTRLVLPNRTGSVLASSKETAGCERNALNSATCKFRQFARHSEQAHPLLRSQLHDSQVTAITSWQQASLGQFQGSTRQKATDNPFAGHMLSNHDLSFDAPDRAIKRCRTTISGHRTTRHGRNPVHNRRSWATGPRRSRIPRPRDSRLHRHVEIRRRVGPAG